MVVTGEAERTGPVKLIDGTTLKGLFEAVRPKQGAYIDHTDYTYVLNDGDEIHIPANLQNKSGRILLSDNSLLRVRIRPSNLPRASPAAASDLPLLNINRASAEALQTLPRIGPETARRIIADRDARGPFRKKEELLRVRGIGRKTNKWLEPLITVD